MLAIGNPMYMLSDFWMSNPINTIDKQNFLMNSRYNKYWMALFGKLPYTEIHNVYDNILSYLKWFFV